MHVITWHQVLKDCKALAGKLKGKDIWGVPRSGSIVAAIMSFHGCALVARRGPGVIVVDDIADTGGTLEHFALNKTATLWVREGIKVLPYYYINTIKGSGYVLFPWENKEVVIRKLQDGRQYKGL